MYTVDGIQTCDYIPGFLASASPHVPARIVHSLRKVKDKDTSAAIANEQGPPRGWKVVTVLLELVQDSCSSSVTDCHLLPPHLFTLLSRRALSLTVSLSSSFHSFPFFLLSSFTLSLALSFTVSLSASFPFTLSLSSSFHCFSSSFSSSLPHYRCLQAEDSERLQLEYTQQLLLGTLLSICDHLTSLGLEEARGTCTCTAQH